MATPARIPILIVTNRLDSGGAERHLLRVLPRLDPRRFDITLSALHAGGSLLPAFEAAGVKLLSGASRVDTLRALKQKVQSCKPLLHCFLPEAYLFAAPIGLFYGASAVLMSRRSRNFYQARHRVAGWVERRLHGRMQRLLANSKAVAQDLLDEGAPTGRVQMLYSGIEMPPPLPAEARSSIRAELGLPQDAVALACVANLFAYKGHADLLSALAGLAESIRGKCHLLLIGRDAGECAALKRQAATVGLSANVHFLGERDDVAELLAASDIGVLASHEEGFSNAVLEGMAASLPMLVTDVGGNAEAVIDGVCGRIVPPHAPAALTLALTTLVADAELRTRWGQAARQRVEAVFSMDQCVQAYATMYAEVWAQARG